MYIWQVVVCFSERMCWLKFNLLSNLTTRYFVELYALICMSMKIFGNAGSVFILAVEILMSYVFVEFSSKSFVVSQLCKSIRQ